jgi:hypothetical protein
MRLAREAMVGAVRRAKAEGRLQYHHALALM